MFRSLPNSTTTWGPSAQNRSLGEDFEDLSHKPRTELSAEEGPLSNAYERILLLDSRADWLPGGDWFPGQGRKWLWLVFPTLWPLGMDSGLLGTTLGPLVLQEFGLLGLNWRYVNGST